MKNAFKFAVAALTLSGTHAIAAPITIGFSGTLTQYTDRSNNIAMHQATAFTGTFTLNLDGRDVETWSLGGQAGAQIDNQGGCSTFVLDKCTSDFGIPLPVISQFTFIGAFGTISLLPDLSGGHTYSYVGKTSSGVNESAVYGLSTGTYIENSDGWSLKRAAAYLSASGANVFSAFDLAEAPHLVGAESARVTFNKYFYTSKYGVSTVEGFDADGQINEMHLVTLSNDVPEPGSLALLGLGLIGIGAAARRKK